jgi:S-DNA-T family DNA segregation ATPase FtsK/SpoIIIE
MRLALTVVSPGAQRMADVVLEADPATPVVRVAAELERFMGTDSTPQNEPSSGTGGRHGARVLRFPGPRSHGSLAMASPDPDGPFAAPLYVAGQRIPPQLSLLDSPIRHGAVISLGSPEGCVAPEPGGLVEIRVVSGPDAGSIYRLPAGQADIGSDQAADVRIRDRTVPAFALRIFVDGRGNCQVAAFEGVRAALDREPLAAAAQWQPGQVIAVGRSLLGLARYVPPDAALRPSADGAGIDFNRPPRLLPPERVTRFQLPAPPPEAERRPLPILMAAVPLLLGVAMAYFLHQVYLLAIAGLSPVMLLGSQLGERRQSRKTAKRRAAAYREHKARIERDAQNALEAERAERLYQFPDPAAVLSIAAGPRRRLWERRRTDPDYLMLRVGTADLPSSVELIDPEQDEHRRRVVWRIPEAPVTISLPERGVVGVAGPGNTPRAIGRWLVAQAAALHSPNDLRMYLLTDSSGKASWQWACWLPHCRPQAGQDSVMLIGNDAESVATRIAELLAVLSARQQAAADTGPRQARFRPDIMVVFDSSRKLRTLPGAVQLLQDGPAAGIYAICLDSEEQQLPAECQAVVIIGRDGVRVQQAKTETLPRIRPDGVQPDWCARLARSLAPVRDVSDADSASALPDSARLLDVLGLEPPAAMVIAGRWRDRGRSTSAVLGESYDGPFGIDIKKDGPHALIAGTTGSGKSELLQAIVASLAAANRPDELTFVLIDYKGGSAFADCAQLPHTVGMVTDLDPHQVARALGSLTAELTRREHLLAAAGAKDIEAYQQLAGQRRAAPLPRLVIVIDEFASMVRELPDFVTGLVNIAQRGRSLGIHLILATQRPSGVVSQDIRANTNLRIALRVTDPAESADVIGVPDAASIAQSTPGRAYVRLGHASIVPFQTARVGGRRPGTDPAATARPWLAPLTWAALGKPEPAPPAHQTAQEAEFTDLTVLVEEIRKAAGQLRIPVPHSPWLAPLPPSLLLGDIMLMTREQEPAAGAARPFVFGVWDLPTLQQQQPAVLSLDAFTHLMAAGAPQSGRSQLLRTIAGTLALAHSAADVHLYGIDCGNGALLPLTELPHCGAVVSRAQTERATRLLKRLATELSRRQELLAAAGYADIREHRAAAPGPGRLPHLFVLLDRWEGFTSTLGELEAGSLTEVLTRLLSEGASAGLHLVMTGDRSLLTGRISALCEEKLVFKLAEKEDYRLAGLNPRDLPDNPPPGRAFRAGSGTELQVALLAPDASGHGQAAALQAIAAHCRSRDAAVQPAQRPFRVDVLPAHVSFADAWQLRPSSAGPLWGMVGVGGDTLAALGPDLASGMPCFIVAGPAKSGRSTILLSMARSFLAAGTLVVLAAPRPSPLRALAGVPGVAGIFDQPELGEDELARALASFTRPGVVLIDDAELLRDCGAAGELSRLIALGGDAGRALVLAGDAERIGLGFSGWQVEAKRARRGLLIEDPSGHGVRQPGGAYSLKPELGLMLAARCRPAFVVIAKGERHDLRPLSLFALGDQTDPVQAIVAELPAGLPPDRAAGSRNSRKLGPLGRIYRYVLVSRASAADLLARLTIAPPAPSGDAAPVRYLVSAYCPDREYPAGYHLTVRGDGTRAVVGGPGAGSAQSAQYDLDGLRGIMLDLLAGVSR